MTCKQWIGQWVKRYAPFSGHVLNHLRLETNACVVRMTHRMSPHHRKSLNALRSRKNLRVNVGCGPFGLPGWVNLDLYSHPEVTLRMDGRRGLPLAHGSCDGIHVEHFLEHLDPMDERPLFLASCRRCLSPDGVLRIIVPDAERYVRAYLEPGWESMLRLGCGGEDPRALFKTKMEALNHVFLQGWEHYGGLDRETLQLLLKDAGFQRVTITSWRQGVFPGGCIDREQHQPYSIYCEARP